MNPISKMNAMLEPMVNYGAPLMLIIMAVIVYISRKKRSQKEGEKASIMMVWIVILFFAAYFYLNDIVNNNIIAEECKNEINKLISEKKKSKKDREAYIEECKNKSFYTFYTLTYTIFGFTTNNSSYYYKF